LTKESKVSGNSLIIQHYNQYNPNTKVFKSTQTKKVIQMHHSQKQELLPTTPKDLSSNNNNNQMFLIETIKSLIKEIKKNINRHTKVS
jgi:hypothetical protein